MSEQSEKVWAILASKGIERKKLSELSREEMLAYKSVTMKVGREKYKKIRPPKVNPFKKHYKKYTAEDVEQVKNGILPVGMSKSVFYSLRTTMRSKGIEVKESVSCPQVSIDVKVAVSNGEVPDDMEISKVYSLRKRLMNEGWDVASIKEHNRCDYDKWSPEEDLMLCGKEIEVPEGRTLGECKDRLKWLKENFIDVGWSSVIGTRQLSMMED